jgi:hypothetical protein
MVQGLDDIDWSRPWLAPYREIGMRVAARVTAGASVARSLNDESPYDSPAAAGGAKPLFVAAALLPAGVAYEAFIARTASVPTRDNLHDFFNGLVWSRFPGLKRRLNRLQADHIALNGVSAQRGRLRDAATLFDENAALLLAPRALLDALREHDWRRLFVEERALWQQSSLTLFGHALLEKLVQPRKAITAHVWVVARNADPLDGLQAQRLARKPFLALPVLGVPGWWEGNVDPAFYDDAAVFRPQPGKNPSVDR